MPNMMRKYWIPVLFCFVMKKKAYLKRMAHVFSASIAVDMLVLDSSTRYTKHPWRHPRGERRKKVTAKTDASTRQKKETKKREKTLSSVFLACIFPSVSPRKIS